MQAVLVTKWASFISFHVNTSAMIAMRHGAGVHGRSTRPDTNEVLHAGRSQSQPALRIFDKVYNNSWVKASTEPFDLEWSGGKVRYEENYGHASRRTRLG
jgi:hypothetical protein